MSHTISVEDYQKWLASLKAGEKVSIQSRYLIAEMISQTNKQCVYVQGWVLEISDFIYVKTHVEPPQFSMQYWVGDTARRFCKISGKGVYRNTEDINDDYQLVPFQETNGRELVYLDHLIYSTK